MRSRLCQESGSLPQSHPEPLHLLHSVQLDWNAQGVPRSQLYGDVYFSAQDGLAESEAVFLGGCNLPQAWLGKSQFVVGELGFGTGLNILALIRLWLQHRPKGGQLHIFTVEAHPMSKDQAQRALATWPGLAALTAALLAQWPSLSRGFHHIDLPEIGVRIDIAIMEALDALKAWDGQANAWFLDGFSPATNPQMWRTEVLSQIAAHSAPGAMAATFTVAGAVRRGLKDAGFEVARKPGFGRKRERLEAIWPNAAASPLPKPPKRVVIIGAGIAGASLARAFRRLAVEPKVYDQDRPGSGASGNAAALVTPRLDLGDGVSAHLYAQGFDHAVRAYQRETPQAILSHGVLQLETQDKDIERFDRIAKLDLFEPAALQRLSAADASNHLGHNQDKGGLLLNPALLIQPQTLLQAWLPTINKAQIASIEKHSDGWALRGPDGSILDVADCICLAAGSGLGPLAGNLPLQIVRGQVSMARGQFGGVPVSGEGYVIPMADRLLFGASHDRDQTDTSVRETDNVANLARLRNLMPTIVNQIEPDAIEARASLRVAGPDHLPVAGLLDGQDGVYVIGGLGGRGFTLSPLLADHIAARAMACPSPLPLWVSQALLPGRFERRRQRQKEKTRP